MKLKKRLAVLLTVAMVMGMTVTTYAGAPTPGPTGVPGEFTMSGNGASEGHVLREVGNVILPTVEEHAFDYTVDPERLVAATGGARYAQTFTSDALQNGVYFLLSTNEYNDKTEDYKFENRSSYPINLTVEVSVADEPGEKDLPLVSADGLAGADRASLYLGLNVGGQKVPVLYGTPAKKTISVDGVFGNFGVSWNGADYVFKVNDNVDDNTWQSTSIQIEGKATDGSSTPKYEIEGDTSTPTINVTWSWEKFVLRAEASSTSIASNAGSVDITIPDGWTITAVEKIKADGVTYNALPSEYYELTDIANGKRLSFTKDLLADMAAANKIKISFSDGDPIVLDVVR